VLRRNSDLRVVLDTPQLTEEKLELYRQYQAAQHERPGDGGSDRLTSAEDLREFLYDSPVPTAELAYYLPDGGLVGVGIVDLTEHVLSSVYFFWRPDQGRRSLGMYSLLRELELARDLGLIWYHLGYWVDRSETMHYKATVADHELLGTDGIWRAAKRADPLLTGSTTTT
jgi:arginine-tRNA-protein transferase